MAVSQWPPLTQLSGRVTMMSTAANGGGPGRDRVVYLECCCELGVQPQGSFSVLLCQAGSKASDRHRCRTWGAHQVKWGVGTADEETDLKISVACSLQGSNGVL